jgi:hypothetical protein
VGSHSRSLSRELSLCSRGREIEGGALSESGFPVCVLVPPLPLGADSASVDTEADERERENKKANTFGGFLVRSALSLERVLTGTRRYLVVSLPSETYDSSYCSSS